jgi:hypothetical protein
MQLGIADWKVDVLGGTCSLLPRLRERARQVTSVSTLNRISKNLKEENRMKTGRWLFPMLLLMAGSALAQDVRYNFDKSADFSKYHTYKWVDVKSQQKVDDLVNNQIRSSIDQQLASKGLTKTDSDTADLYVGYQVAINTEKQATTWNDGWGYGPGWGAWGMGGMGMSQTTTSTLYVGTLAVDMYDVSQKNTVWRGMATKTLDQKAKPDKRQKNLDKALTKMFKNYPPPKK